jgi:hypothetical protein
MTILHRPKSGDRGERVRIASLEASTKGSVSQLTGLLHGFVDLVRGSLLKLAELGYSLGLVIQLLDLLQLSMFLPICVGQFIVLLPVHFVLGNCGFSIVRAVQTFA